MESNDMWVFYSLQQDHLIVDHPLVAFDILLQYDLDGESLSVTLGFPDDPICTGAKRSSKFVLSSVRLDE